MCLRAAAVYVNGPLFTYGCGCGFSFFSSIPITFPFLIIQGVLPIGIEWAWLLGIGVFTQIGQMLITDGLRILPAGYAGSINYTQVLFASIWGLLIFSEPLTLSIIIGAAFVLGATLISLSDLPDF